MVLISHYLDLQIIKINTLMNIKFNGIQAIYVKIDNNITANKMLFIQ